MSQRTHRLEGRKREEQGARKHSTSQTMAHQLEGRKEKRVRELRNIAHHKRRLTNWRGGRGRSGELGNVACHKQQLNDWRGGRRSRFMSLETWHVTEDSPTRGEEKGGVGS